MWVFQTKEILVEFSDNGSIQVSWVTQWFKSWFIKHGFKGIVQIYDLW